MSALPRPAPQTFRAADMPAALEAVQRALGPEALIVSVRQVAAGPAWQVWKKAGVEVVALGAAGQKPVAAVPAAPSARPLTKPAVRAPLPTASAAAPAAATVASDASSPALIAAHEQLLAQGLDPLLARKVTTLCGERLSADTRRDAQRVRWHLEQQLEAGLHTQSNTVLAAQHVLCLVGSTGSGKTTAAARLATHFAREGGRSVAWISADTIRAGAIAQARVYAEALKLPLRIVYTPDELSQAVAAEAGASDLLLVDLPGCNPRSEADVAELGGLLAALPQRATYWVAPATAKDADLADGYAALAPFRLSGLIVTKVDETGTFGSVFNLAWRTRLPLAYFTTGPRVLGTLHPADPADLVRALFEGDFPA